MKYTLTNNIMNTTQKILEEFEDEGLKNMFSDYVCCSGQECGCNGEKQYDFILGLISQALLQVREDTLREVRRITENTSDGYHTFKELYEHRVVLWIALCKILYNDPQYQTGQKADVWRSKLHSDGTSFDGWFVLGIGRNKGEQITYHLPLSKWEDTNFAETREKAPEFDGHTSDDVLKRLASI